MPILSVNAWETGRNADQDSVPQGIRLVGLGIFCNSGSMVKMRNRGNQGALRRLFRYGSHNGTFNTSPALEAANPEKFRDFGTEAKVPYFATWLAQQCHANLWNSARSEF